MASSRSTKELQRKVLDPAQNTLKNIIFGGLSYKSVSSQEILRHEDAVQAKHRVTE